MERTVVLDKMKKLDNIVIALLTFCVLFVVVLTVQGALKIPLYFGIVLVVLNVVTIIITSVNKRYNKELIQTVNNSFSAIYNNDLSSIKNNNSNEIYNLVNVLINEMEDVKSDLDTLLKLTRSVEKDELKDFNVTSKNKNVNSAIRVVKSIEFENNTNRKVTTEFFKNVKTGKFNDIEVNSENIIQQQLNIVLQNMYIMSSNLRIVQSAIFEGEYDVELITAGIDGDFLNLTNKLNTLLNSVKKSTNNLNKAILMMDEENSLNFTKSMYKGNLVTNFKLIEMVYENLRLSVDNIVYALENGEEISVDNVSSLFNPIIEVISSDGYEKISLGNKNKNNKVENKTANDSFNNIRKHYTGNYEIIENIENNLNDLKATMETNEFLNYEVNDEYTYNDEEVQDINKTEPKIEIDLEVEIVENNGKLDSEEIQIEIVENNRKLDSEEIQLEIIENNEQLDNEEINSEIEIAENNEQVNNVKHENSDIVFENLKTYNNIENNSIEYSNKVSEQSLQQANKKSKMKVTKENNSRAEVSRLSQANNSSKKPLTYQEAIKTGQIEELTKNKRKVNTLSNNLANRSLKEPMTYQKFLDSKAESPNSTSGENKTSPTSTKHKKSMDTLISDSASARNNLMKQEAEKKERRERLQNQSNITRTENSRTTSTTTPKKPERTNLKDKKMSESDSLKRRSKLEEQMGRKLTNRERNELDMYGEILTDKYRAIMETITNESDLGGF